MARIKADGLDAVVKMLKNLSTEISGKQPEILETGAKVLVEEWKAVIEEKGHVDTGTMRDSVAATAPKQIAGGYAIEVYPQGTDSTGTRNAEKAFLLHYGWKKKNKKKSKQKQRAGKSAMQGDHFVDEIERRGGERAVKAMQDELARITDKHN